MAEKVYQVTLAHPVKIDGVIEPAGKTLTVTSTIADQIAASIEAGSRVEVSEDDGLSFERAVTAEVEKTIDAAISAALVTPFAEIAELKVARDDARDRLKATEERVRAEIGDEYAAALTRIAELEADVKVKADRIDELEELISSKNAEAEDAAEEAAKNTAKDSKKPSSAKD